MISDTFDLEKIQKAIRQNKQCDGWLIYDFHGYNSIALEVLHINPSQILTRRFFYWIPKTGTAIKLVHQVEEDSLDHLPGQKHVYDSWESLELQLNKLVAGKKCIAMEHTTDGAMPIISKLDSGTYEWITKKGLTVLPSWQIAQHFVCRLNKEQENSHKKAAKLLVKAYKSAWSLLEDALKKRKKITEYDLQQHIVEMISEENHISSILPIVAVDANTALPHYIPTQKTARQIKEGMLLLIDLSAKKNSPNSIFSDITQVVYIGKKAPQELIDHYAIVYEAQKKALCYLQDAFANNRTVLGCEIDDICRKHVNEHGLGKYFVHRTGHNLWYEMHGIGPSLDNFETRDTRELLSRSCYSIEPAIYFPGSYGIRLECNIIIDETKKVVLTAQSHKTLPCLG